MDINKQAFIQGFSYGKRQGEEPTARLVEYLHPEYTVDEVDAFRCGAEDGAKGDTWRLDRL